MRTASILYHEDTLCSPDGDPKALLPQKHQDLNILDENCRILDENCRIRYFQEGRGVFSRGILDVFPNELEENVMQKALKIGKKIGLSPENARTLAELGSPELIQDFINSIPWNTEPDGDTARSVSEILRLRQAHCAEGAFVAACALWMAGHPPLLMDMGASEVDVDHVVALFRRDNYWGAISKSNSPFLRYRDPIYRTLRELSISYFPQYVLKREKTLRTYSVSIDLRKVDPRLWVTHQGYCLEMIEILTSVRHFDLLPDNFRGDQLRPIDLIEAHSNNLTEHVEPKKIIRLDGHLAPASPLDQVISAEP